MSFEEMDSFFEGYGGNKPQTINEQGIEAVLQAHGTIAAKHTGSSGKYRVLLPLLHGSRAEFAQRLANNHDVFTIMCDYQIRYALCLADLDEQCADFGIAHSIEGFDPAALAAYEQADLQESNNIFDIIESIRSNIPSGIEQLTLGRSNQDKVVFFNGLNAWNSFYAMQRIKKRQHSIVPGRSNEDKILSDQMLKELEELAKKQAELSEQEYLLFINRWKQKYIDDYRQRHTYMKHNVQAATIGTISLGSAHFSNRIKHPSLPAIEQEFADDTYWVVELDSENSVHDSIQSLGVENKFYPFSTSRKFLNSYITYIRQSN